MTPAEAVKNQVAKQTEKKTVAWYLDNQKQKIAEALPSCGLTIDRFTRLAISTLNNSPELQKCDTLSFMKSMMTCAQLGLEPSPVLGTCYLLPFNNRKAGKMEVQFILGYKGMITLARRSGEILSMSVRPVYKNDIFKIGFGMEDTLEHVPYGCREDEEFADSGVFRGVYMVCKFKDGGHLIDYMPKAEIERHRAKSLAKDFGPWKDFYEEMALKTIIRKNFKYLPSSTDTINAVENSDDTQPPPSRFAPSVETSFVEVPHIEEVDTTTGEITETVIVAPAVLNHSHTDLLQEVYILIGTLSEKNGDSPDDTIDTLTKHKIGSCFELEDKPEAYLFDIKLLVETAIAKGA
jgi:recombination protein RecT